MISLSRKEYDVTRPGDTSDVCELGGCNAVYRGTRLPRLVVWFWLTGIAVRLLFKDKVARRWARRHGFVNPFTYISNQRAQDRAAREKETAALREWREWGEQAQAVQRHEILRIRRGHAINFVGGNFCG